MNLLTATPAKFCRVTEACEEGREFASRYDTMADVWDNCPRADWLLWIADKIGQRQDNRTLRLFAVWCARNTPLGDGWVTGDLLTDPRSLAALEVAGRYAEGRATKEELNAARLAAFDAAFDAADDAADDAAADAAAYAASAAADAAADAAAYAASAASAYAAYASAAAYAAADTTYASAAYADAADDDASAAADVVASRRAQADQLRRMVPNPFRAKEVKP